jgi:hypothetical protein
MILLNEEFGVTIEHIKGEDNTGGDGLSRLAFLDTASETDSLFKTWTETKITCFLLTCVRS